MRVLTKSRFKLGLECPNKLFFTRKNEYANIKQEDPFLLALAQGGFQVEELARMHYPSGILIEGHDGDYQNLWKQTQELLKAENIVIYEAAFLIDGLFIRTDILVKKGNHVELIEVKAKSFDPSDPNVFVGKKGDILSDWWSYLYDVAYQKHVMKLCYPQWKIDSYILMADKTKTTSIDGLNQLFRISKDAENRTGIKKLVTTLAETGNSVLSRKNINDIVEGIESNKHKYYDNLTFQEAIKSFKEHYESDKYFNWPTSFSACKACEFRTTPEHEAKGLKSGFKECFEKQHKWSKSDFEKPATFDVWNFRKGENLFKDKIFFMSELTQDKIGYKEESGRLSMTARQWIQIEKATKDDKTIYVDKDLLAAEMKQWKFPLHFIDFETSAAALPFNKDRRPYEQIAFQFSHHTYYEDGKIEHASEFINSTAGVFPNYEFVRTLKKALSKDAGTIFRYAPHENNILNAIHEQLSNSAEHDKKELMDFIESISHSTSSNAKKWKGDRDMVDLWDLIKACYYNPLTKGSNSIKAVLPSVLNTSTFLQKKYSQPLGNINVTSANFKKDHIWIRLDKGFATNPYEMLPPVFQGWSEDDIENTLSEIEDVANGGAALTAYSKLQYTDMSDAERKDLSNALLKYCELDTLAMVMIYEHFKEDLIK